MDDNAIAKASFIEAFFDHAEGRVAFLEDLARQGHPEEAMTLCLVYIDSFAQWLYWPSSKSGQNFTNALIEFGNDQQLGLIHPLQAHRAFDAMKGNWKAITSKVALAFPGVT
jgi:hypothetical protein